MTTDQGVDPSDKKYLVIPLEGMAVVKLDEIVKELAGLRDQIAMLTAGVLKVTMEMTRSNDLESDKIRFSKMKDLLVAKMSRMLDKDRKKEVASGTAIAEQP